MDVGSKLLTVTELLLLLDITCCRRSLKRLNNTPSGYTYDSELLDSKGFMRVLRDNASPRLRSTDIDVPAFEEDTNASYSMEYVHPVARSEFVCKYLLQ